MMKRRTCMLHFVAQRSITVTASFWSAKMDFMRSSSGGRSLSSCFNLENKLDEIS